MSQNLKLILILSLLSLAIRLIYLDRIPTGITNDELHYVLNSKAVFYNFSDIGSRWNPLSLTTIPREASSELNFLLFAPIIGPLPTNLFTARLPSIIISTLSVIFIYLLVGQLLSPAIGFLSALVATFNPWHIYLARTSFDPQIASFFFILTLYLLTKLKGNKILLAIFPALFAFHTYIGTKIVFLPFTLISSCFCWRWIHHRRYGKIFILFNFFCLAIVLRYVFNLQTQSAGQRLSEFLTPNHPSIITQVEAIRNQTIPTSLTRLFANRYVVYLKTILAKYLNNFSPNVLFLRGDEAFMISLWQQGYFYYLDIIFLLVGFYFLFRVHPKTALFLSGLILLSPLPEALRSDTIPAYAFHSSFQYPFLFIVVGSGLYFFFRSQTVKPVKILVVVAYFLCFLNFVDIYFFRYPIYQPEGFSFSRRILSHYINLELAKQHSVYVLTREPSTHFRTHLFFTNRYQRHNFDAIAKIYQQPDLDQIDFGNLHLATRFNDNSIASNATIIVETGFNSRQYPGQRQLSINHLANNSPIYRIYSPKSCLLLSSSEPKHYQLTDFSLEKLTEDSFCQKFITSN